MDKQDDAGCSTVLTFIGLGWVAFLLYKFVQFLLTPDGIKSIVQLIGTVGACLGLVVLSLVVLYVHGRFFYRDSYSKLVSMSKDYRMRCQAADMAQTTPDADQAKPSDDLVQATGEPIYVLFSLTNYGPGLEVASMPAAWLGTTADNARRFGRLTANRPDPIILPMFYFHLYYTVCRQAGNLTSESAPPNDVGYTGPLPALSEGSQPEVVIVYSAICTTEDLKIITLARPLKLTLVALDEAGHDDQAATCEVYNLVLGYLQPPDSDEDDSWMYRSRPTSMWY